MSEDGIRIDLRVGDFALSVQGMEDPIRAVKQIMRHVQRVVEETPEIAQARVSLDDEVMDELMASLAQQASLGAADVTVTPGIVVTSAARDAAPAATVSAAPAVAAMAAGAAIAAAEAPAEDQPAEPEGGDDVGNGVIALGEAPVDLGPADDLSIDAPPDLDSPDTLPEPEPASAEEVPGPTEDAPVAGDDELGAPMEADADLQEPPAETAEVAEDAEPAPFDDPFATAIPMPGAEQDDDIEEAPDGNVLVMPFAAASPPRETAEEAPGDSWEDDDAVVLDETPGPGSVSNIFGEDAAPAGPRDDGGMDGADSVTAEDDTFPADDIFAQPAASEEPEPAEPVVAEEPAPEPEPAPVEVAEEPAPRNIFAAAEPEPAAAPPRNIFAAAEPEPAAAPPRNIFADPEPAEPEPAPRNIFASPAPAAEAESGPRNIFAEAEPAPSEAPSRNIFADPDPQPEPAPAEAGTRNLFGAGGGGAAATGEVIAPGESASGGRFSDLMSRLDRGQEDEPARYDAAESWDAEEEDLGDGPSWSAGEIATAAGAENVAEILAASAAWLTVIRGQRSFTRREVMAVFDEIPGDHPRTLEARIKGYGRLVRNGDLVLVEDGLFALSDDALESYETLVLG